MDQPKDKLDESDEQSKAYLRQIVIEAAMGGLKRKPRASRKNPLYKPNPQYGAMLTVSAGCRDMMDKVRGMSPDYILGGFIDAAQRKRNLASIREYRDFLNTVLEAADA